MSNFTIAQGRAVGIQPAATSEVGSPANMFLDYEFDGAKRSTATSDTIDLFEIPAYAALVVNSAAVSVVKAGTASCALSLSLGAGAAAGTDITGLTAWAADAAAGTQLVKLATAANSIVSTTTSNFLKLKFNTAAIGSGKVRVRVSATLMTAPPATV